MRSFALRLVTANTAQNEYEMDHHINQKAAIYVLQTFWINAAPLDGV